MKSVHEEDDHIILIKAKKQNSSDSKKFTLKANVKRARKTDV